MTTSRVWLVLRDDDSFTYGCVDTSVDAVYDNEEAARKHVLMAARILFRKETVNLNSRRKKLWPTRQDLERAVDDVAQGITIHTDGSITPHASEHDSGLRFGTIYTCLRVEDMEIRSHPASGES